MNLTKDFLLEPRFYKIPSSRYEKKKAEIASSIFKKAVSIFKEKENLEDFFLVGPDFGPLLNSDTIIEYWSKEQTAEESIPLIGEAYCIGKKTIDKNETRYRICFLVNNLDCFVESFEKELYPKYSFFCNCPNEEKRKKNLEEDSSNYNHEKKIYNSRDISKLEDKLRKEGKIL